MGRGGVYSGIALRDDPVAAGAQTEIFIYTSGYSGAVETRAGIAGLVAGGEGSISGGIDIGLRVRSPSRLALFAGIGGYLGSVSDSGDLTGLLADDEADAEFAAAAYPELGAHFWLTPQWRLTASASHYSSTIDFTTINDGSNFTLDGISLARLSIPRGRPKPFRLSTENPLTSVSEAVNASLEHSPNALPGQANRGNRQPR